MGFSPKHVDPKSGADHVEKVSSSSLGEDELLDDLDSIELTQSGKYAWLVAITAGK
jgi:SP family myo-inositol transporter-like MFS transporter 13